ncbi:Ephrin type-A receptor 4A, putative [Entamoeba invadens IP1]|uniref:Ephrin type-A receptor 4A, putative n=1 Tax=Entamoeba invadens IP1 TaxID=370355 RepID=A0A0A1UFK3_ENTIV|nr:Ephrin type-A receptor 4A, putative [Entamoeba invadens IP1]ELP91713.1 Ephrin type-A receptor 4A, putative [Entamoeba invadens IP1]|eukprot:XP_004258484.1 Ephrin type-A receptor 4A, putative [Entamoeba invadens IP1]
MIIISEYFQDIQDFVNLELVSKKYQDNMEKFNYNPIPLTKKTIAYFPNIETLNLWSTEDESFGISITQTSNKGLSFLFKNSTKHYKFQKIVVWFEVDVKTASKNTNPKIQYKNVPFRSVVTVGNHSFDGCFSLTSVSIPYSVVSIGNFCFNECSNLRTVTLSASTLRLGDFCFNKCSNLSQIKLPSTLKTFNSLYHNNCGDLEDFDQIEESGKEVFFIGPNIPNPYIIWVYCFVLFPKQISEEPLFTQYGSLYDLMRNKNSYDIDTIMKVKLMLDTAKGLSYLHEFGFVHCKLSSFHVFVNSLDFKDDVNGKLTLFNNYKDLYCLLKNVDNGFEPSVGSGIPVYMAPELTDSKPTTASDVFAFAIIILECLTWKNAYNEKQFKYPSKIIGFVKNGNRLPIDIDNDDIKILIEDMWKQESQYRPNINTVVDRLIKIYNEFN